MIPKNTNEKVIIVTGAANGICRQIAKDLDSPENILCLFDQNPDLVNVTKELNNAKVHSLIGDVSLEKDVNHFVEEILVNYSKVDVLINGAGVVPYEPLMETSYELYKNTLNTNLGGYFLFSRAVAGSMIEKKKGVIVNIASISAQVGIRGQAAYASSKGGIVALTHVLASELGIHGIRVNAIAPGSILVDRNRVAMLKKWADKKDLERHISLGRLGTPSDISGVVQFLLSDSSSYVHGATITVDGGLTTKGV